MPDQPRVLVAGTAAGEVLHLDEPLSFWGGLDATDGRIIDRRHPQVDRVVAGRVLAMPHGRGSSSASSVLCEAVRAGTAPVAILMAEPDELVALGAIVAEEIYGVVVPVVVVGREAYQSLVDGERVTVGPDGTVGRA